MNRIRGFLTILWANQDVPDLGGSQNGFFMDPSVTANRTLSRRDLYRQARQAATWGIVVSLGLGWRNCWAGCSGTRLPWFLMRLTP